MATACIYRKRPIPSTITAAYTVFPGYQWTNFTHTSAHTTQQRSIEIHIFLSLSEMKKKEMCYFLIMFPVHAEQDSIKLMWQCISMWVMLQYYHFTSASKPKLKLDCKNWAENGHPSSSDPWNGLWSVPSHFTANFMRWDERRKYVCGFMHEPRFMAAV